MSLVQFDTTESSWQCRRPNQMSLWKDEACETDQVVDTDGQVTTKLDPSSIDADSEVQDIHIEVELEGEMEMTTYYVREESKGGKSSCSEIRI